MTNATATPVFQLDDSDKNVIRRFIGVLHDMGIQSAIMLAVVRNISDHEIAAKSVGVAIEDLGNTCKSYQGVVGKPEDVVDAAPSLKLVVEFARLSGVFPEDFLPDDLLVNSCLAQFFQNARNHAAQSVEPSE